MNKRTHIVTDSAGAQTGKYETAFSVSPPSYPQHVKWHKHAKLLGTIVHHILQSKDTIHPFHPYKVKAHAGNIGNECADAIANCSAAKQSGHAIIHNNTDAHPNSSISGRKGWNKTLPQFVYQTLLTPANQGRQQKGPPFCTLLGKHVRDISTCNLHTRKITLRTYATVKLGTDNSILS